MLKQNRRLKKKLTVVFVVILVYIFGQNIPLPYVQINTAESYSNQTFLQMLQTINGSDRQAFSIFSLGIIPYMMASILLMLKSLGESDKKQLLAKAFDIENIDLFSEKYDILELRKRLS